MFRARGQRKRDEGMKNGKGELSESVGKTRRNEERVKGVKGKEKNSNDRKRNNYKYN